MDVFLRHVCVIFWYTLYIKEPLMSVKQFRNVFFTIQVMDNANLAVEQEFMYSMI